MKLLLLFFSFLVITQSVKITSKLHNVMLGGDAGSVKHFEEQLLQEERNR